MTDLTFDIEWIEPESTEIPEFGATWAALRIFVDEHCVTRFYDRHTNSVRKTLILPLYPLAEWIAGHWWNLLYETVVPDRGATDYPRRHNLRYGREGFALPDLQCTPAGASVSMEWTAADLNHYGVEFLGSGQAWVERADVEYELARVLDTVTQRLEQNDLRETPLQKEWADIQSADTDERDFCEAAARLGFYPYDVPSSQEETILNVAESLPQELYSAFFGAAQPARITDQAERLVEILQTLQRLDQHASRLPELREEVASYQSQYAPWKEGYEYARMLRREHFGEDALFQTTEDVAQAFFLDGNGATGRVREYDSGRLFDALVVNDNRGGPGFALDKHRDDAKKFALCRGLFEYLNAPNGQPLLVTREQTEQQQRNRAFAAEFLAPSSLLSEAISGHTADEEVVEDLAEEFGVSSLVIQHQLENHDVVDEIVS